MFRWTLTNEDTGEKLQLTKDPYDWENITFEHERSDKYEGIFKNFSEEFSFSCKGGGKEFLDAIFKEKGSEGNASLKCDFACQGNFRHLFTGYVHFPTYTEKYRGKTLHTVVEIRKGGIAQTVLARDEMDVDLLSETSIGGVSLNHYDYAPYVFNLHSRIIFIESDWDVEDHSCCYRVITTGLKELYAVPELTVIKDDVSQTSDTEARCHIDNTFNGFLNSAPAIVDLTNNDLIIQANTFTVDWNISGSMVWNTFDVSTPEPGCATPTCGTGALNQKLIDSIQGRLRLFYGNPNGDLEESCATPQSNDNIKYIDLVSTAHVLGAIPYTVAFAGSGTENIILNPGDKVWFHWVIDINFLSASGDITIDFTYSDNSVNLSSETQSDASTAKVVAIHEAWSRICEGITDQTLAFKSTFFGRTDSQGLNYPVPGYGGWTVVTDGLRIRGFEKSDDPVLSDGQTKKGIITNVKDMYESCNAIWGVGLSIETHEGTEVVRVEEKDYFYQDTEIYKISNIPGMEMSFQEDMAYSEVHIGYEKWRIQNKGGLDEPNTQAKWVFPKIKNIKNTKELISPYVGGMYAIEETRRKKPSITEDSSFDDDIFLIATRREFSRFDEAERNENILITAGTLLAPDTSYNLRFNLFSNFDRTMNQFTTNLTKDAPQQINYSYLEGNGQMEFRYYINFVPQQGELNNLQCKNVQNTEIPNGRHKRQYPILLPEIYTFTFPIPYSDYLDILDNPYGYISFSETNKNYKKGYIKTLSYHIAKQMAEFSLILKFD